MAINDIQKWTLCLCACSVLVSAAEILLPEGAVKKSVYFVLSLIAASCLLRPLENIRDFRDVLFEGASADSSEMIVTDWFGEAANSEYERRIMSLVADELKRHGVEAKKITVETSISDGGSVLINKVRIIVDAHYTERLDEIETAVMNDLGLDADIVVR